LKTLGAGVQDRQGYDNWQQCGSQYFDRHIVNISKDSLSSWRRGADRDTNLADFRLNWRRTAAGNRRYKYNTFLCWI
jgi:hypothetical protein